MFVEVIVPQGKNIIIGDIYKPPNENLNTFVKSFNEVTDKITKENKLCYLMGDFNVNLMNYHRINLTGEFLDNTYSNSLCPLINRPTRITSHSATLIDNILTNNIDSHVVNELLFTDISDHLQSGLLRILISVKTIPYTLSRDKSKENIKTFEKNIINCDWTTISSLNDPTEDYTRFSDNFTRIFNECFPIKTRSKKFKIHKQWISNGLLKSIKTKNRLYKQYIRHPDPTRETKYKKYKNKLIHSI